MERQSKFLYGAAVQGIQEFIFQTNELKDIAGASELVENICTECFKEFVGSGKLIVSAAGNIKCFFDNEQECRHAVLEFPKKVMLEAPGITISEAVVRMDTGMDFESAVNLLEQRLRVQRNRRFPSITTGLIGIERSRKTGLPAVATEKDEFVDLATFKKRKNIIPESNKQTTTRRLMEKALGLDSLSETTIAHQLDKMIDQNNWIAVIHADGNGLGNIVSQIGKKYDLLTEFSSELEKATSAASCKAYREVLKSDIFKANSSVVPFRPVVLGGDDLTMICRADLAIPFTKAFIEHFEIETGKMLDKLKEKATDLQIPYLTACAGIAFIKSSFPFYYGYHLAEELCGRAKRDAKREVALKAPSCLMFHKVQSSFVENYDDIVKKELIPCEGYSFEFGPYYLKEKASRWTIDHLCERVNQLSGKNGNAIKSDIRQWMTLMSEDVEKAEQKAQRVRDISQEKDKKIFEEAIGAYTKDGVKYYPAYDILTIHTIQSLVTNN